MPFELGKIGAVLSETGGGGSEERPPPVNRVTGNATVRRGLTVPGVKIWVAGIFISMLVTVGR